ncbi:fumarylacetoacetate hydrolase family protein [Parafrigoribacterium soli]|uniref:fumarylacetoacetate hydrolase family protein n=1 Tax=Parafrigoribacterium soli TaxID=3144663 RepID=UPI0032EC1E7B
MKIATWMQGTDQRCGFVHDGETFALAPDVTVLDLVRSGLDAALALGRERLEQGDAVPLGEVRLLPPLAPPSVRDFVTFEEHVEGIVKSAPGGDPGVVPQWYEAPTFYFTNPHTLRASGERVTPPWGEQALDFELEVATIVGAVAGSDGRSLTPEAASEHIFGYTIFNDWSARDLQFREMKVNLGPCKGKDFATTLGPWIVTADEFTGHDDDDGFLDLSASVSINGELFGRDSLSHMGWSFADLVAYASRSSRVVPGDVLGSGTTGHGCLAEIWGRAGHRLPRPLQPGDVVRMDVEGIGYIENEIAEPVPTPAIRQARPRRG